MNGLAGSRRVRPRPINVNERMHVVRTHSREERVDSTLAAFLSSQEEEQQQLKAQEQQARRQQEQQANAHIVVPQVREIEDYNANQSALQLSSTARYKEIDPVNSAYIRNQDLFAPQTMEQVLTSYDLDDQDEQWLAKYNAKASKGQRSQAASPSLSEESFEALVGKLEALVQEAVVQDSSWQEPVKAGKIPKLPAAERLLPRGTAATKLREQGHDQAASLAVYDYWLLRRRQAKGPLLGHLWFEQPWKSIAFGAEGQGHMPFEATETKNSRFGNRVRMSPEEALDVMHALRDELELLRIVADQVRKRERLKKQLLKIWRAQKLGLPINLASLPPLRSTLLQPAAKPGRKKRARVDSGEPGLTAAATVATAGGEGEVPAKRRRGPGRKRQVAEQLEEEQGAGQGEEQEAVEEQGEEEPGPSRRRGRGAGVAAGSGETRRGRGGKRVAAGRGQKAAGSAKPGRRGRRGIVEASDDEQAGGSESEEGDEDEDEEEGRRHVGSAGLSRSRSGSFAGEEEELEGDDDDEEEEEEDGAERSLSGEVSGLRGGATSSSGSDEDEERRPTNPSDGPGVAWGRGRGVRSNGAAPRGRGVAGGRGRGRGRGRGGGAGRGVIARGPAGCVKPGRGGMSAGVGRAMTAAATWASQLVRRALARGTSSAHAAKGDGQGHGRAASRAAADAAGPSDGPEARGGLQGAEAQGAAGAPGLQPGAAKLRRIQWTLASPPAHPTRRRGGGIVPAKAGRGGRPASSGRGKPAASDAAGSLQENGYRGDGDGGEAWTGGDRGATDAGPSGSGVQQPARRQQQRRRQSGEAGVEAAAGHPQQPLHWRQRQRAELEHEAEAAGSLLGRAAAAKPRGKPGAQGNEQGSGQQQQERQPSQRRSVGSRERQLPQQQQQQRRRPQVIWTLVSEPPSPADSEVGGGGQQAGPSGRARRQEAVATSLPSSSGIRVQGGGAVQPKREPLLGRARRPRQLGERGSLGLGRAGACEPSAAAGADSGAPTATLVPKVRARGGRGAEEGVRQADGAPGVSGAAAAGGLGSKLHARAAGLDPARSPSAKRLPSPSPPGSVRRKADALRRPAAPSPVQLVASGSPGGHGGGASGSPGPEVPLLPSGVPLVSSDGWVFQPPRRQAAIAASAAITAIVDGDHSKKEQGG